MVVAIAAVLGSVMGRAQNRAADKLGVPVEGTPRMGKEICVTDTGTSTPQRCKGLSGEAYKEVQQVGRRWAAEWIREYAQELDYLTQKDPRRRSRPPVTIGL